MKPIVKYARNTNPKTSPYIYYVENGVSASKFNTILASNEMMHLGVNECELIRHPMPEYRVSCP